MVLKARIRATFSDTKKQQELISQLYAKFVAKPEMPAVANPVKKEETKKEPVKVAKAVKVKVKKEKVAKK